MTLPSPILARRCAAALAAHPATGQFAALAVASSDPMADVARTVESQILGAAARDHADHEDQSLFLLVLDRESNLPAAVGRVVEGGGRTLDDAPGLIGRDLSDIVEAHGLHDGGKIWELATIGVLPAHRGDKAVSSLLYRTFLQAGHRAGVRHVVALPDRHAHRALALLGVPFVAMAGSEPFDHFGSAGTRAVYVPFAGLEPAIAEQSERLNRPVGPFAGEIRARGLRRLLVRRAAARVSEQVATGYGLNEQIVLPGLERRRFRGLKTKR
ncbi:hypothetical protein [Paractinoplanes brasiliensis]|uniref:Acetyltransferase (GNAT) family protein n=1 Tax=Paractinoplanes brasiliensis TaxID=52695 RepID=A0A4R6JPA0_9ACTN|nr:hypothetical protein [Actinoplanes brasiliensis]TDO38099.1 hypothetical protein C8E87_1741 [Actinoplanes brasiliensis]GID31191.1 hypothetical protein Abr02nite_61740 [Actinoplanes brasiliensis]